MLHETVLLIWRNNIITVALLGEAESSKGCDHAVCLCALCALCATMCHYLPPLCAVHNVPPPQCALCIPLSATTTYVHYVPPLCALCSLCTIQMCCALCATTTMCTMCHHHVQYVLASVPPVCAMLPLRPPAVHTTCVLDGDSIPSYPIISYHTTPHVPLIWLSCHNHSLP